MSEIKLDSKKGPNLFQQVMPDVAPAGPKKRGPALHLPVCAERQKVFGETIRLAAPGGKWKCGRGHGILGG